MKCVKTDRNFDGLTMQKKNYSVYLISDMPPLNIKFAIIILMAVVSQTVIGID